jgi:serine/threonine protein kinase
MSHLDHPNIAKVIEAYERHRHIYLIMEYCSGDNLCEREFTEEQTSIVVRKILSAVAYMHDNNVVHRDIKLENIMFDKPGENGEVKIIDFGLATRYLSDEHKRMTDRVGTLYSMAPQVLQGVYDDKCDLWSIGVVAYILLSGKQPFWGPPREMPWEQRKKIMMDRIMRCDYMRMTAGKWTNISKEAKDFVAAMLQMDPKKRPSARNALEHSWMKRHARYKIDLDPVAPQTSQCGELKELKASARRAMVKNLSDEKLRKLREALESRDSANEGHVTVKEFLATLSKFDCSLTGSSMELSSLDIDYVELLADIVESKCRRRSERWAELFAQIDEGQTGKASKDHLAATLKDAVDSQLLNKVLEKVSVDSNGMVSVKDLLSSLNQANEAIVAKASGTGTDQQAQDSEVLATPQNTVIPGGRKTPSERTLFVFDTKTNSIRKSSHQD